MEASHELIGSHESCSVQVGNIILGNLVKSSNSNGSKGINRPAKEPEKLSEKNKSEINILIVDDDPATLRLLNRVFRQQGYNVVTAASGEDAVKCARETSFDVAFIDIRLPGINGVETYKEIARINPALKAMMMTAYATNEIMEELVKLNVYGCLKKPFELAEINKELDKLISS